jgi:hypothetical protein
MVSRTEVVVRLVRLKKEVHINKLLQKEVVFGIDTFVPNTGQADQKIENVC